jgi:hypothetical protein
VGSTQVQQQYPDGLEIIVTPTSQGSTQQTQQDFNLSCGGRPCTLGQSFTTPITQPDGSLFQVQFKPATQDDWNRLIAEWQSSLGATYRAQQQALAQARQAQADAKARADAQSQIDREAKQLMDDVATIVKTGIPDDLVSANSVLKSQGQTLQRMQSDLAKEQQDAAVRPMTYQQANGTVYQDYNGTLYQDYNGTLYQQQSQLSNVLSGLQSRIDNGHKSIAAIQQELQDLDSAQKNGFRVTTDFTAASSALASYQATVASAEKQIPGFRTQQDSIKQQAADLMSQGQSVLKAAVAACKC